MTSDSDLIETLPGSEQRLIRAERNGLKLAIICRTVAIFLGGAYWVGATWNFGGGPKPIALFLIALFLAIGIVNFALIGTRHDQRWLKYLMYTADILGVCAIFAFLPVSTSSDVPQIFAFRTFGNYYLFPLVAMACLSLSWRLVAWCGLVSLIGWWAAFGFVVSGMERSVSWSDLTPDPKLQDYLRLFSDPDFIELGTRVQESGFLFVATMILALTVRRARKVFFAQIRAEAEREAAREDRERVARRLGRYVPEAIARRLMQDESALAPQVRDGAVLIMDIQKFTTFAASRTPTEVIGRLNGFLSDCAGIVSAQDGVVISYTGDGLLATFNTPLEIDAPEAAALRAAAALRDYSAGTEFAIRVGIAAGPVAAGSVGSEERQAFTVYGDTVNRAARLEALGKDINQSIVLDGAVAVSVEGLDGMALESAGTHNLRGIAAATDVWVLPVAVKSPQVR